MVKTPQETKRRTAASQRTGRVRRPGPDVVPQDSLLMSFFDVSQPFPVPNRTGTEAKIIDGARRCFFHYGPEKISMNDVAQMAGVSRASLYNYFSSREAVVEAVIDLVGQVFAEDLGRAMAKGETFEEQVAEGALAFLTWTEAGRRHFAGTPSYDRTMQTFSVHADPTYARTMETVLPYVALARRRGEVRADLDLDRAAEWVTRILWSFVSFAPRTFDREDPEEVAAFVQTHLVRGLA